MNKYLAAGAFILAVIFSVLIFGQASAQVPTPSDDDVNAIAKQLYCPVCESTPLDVCPTTACQQWRDLIRQKLSEGQSAQAIKDYFATQYGDRVLAQPPREGLNWLVYILPPVTLLIGAAILYLTLRNLRKKANAVKSTPAAAATETQAEDEYLRRMEEELRRRE